MIATGIRSCYIKSLKGKLRLTSEKIALDVFQIRAVKVEEWEEKKWISTGGLSSQITNKLPAITFLICTLIPNWKFNDKPKT